MEEFSVDLAKAHDWINHEFFFLAKLHNHGIQGVSEDWFTSYLTNRRQKIEVKSPNTVKTFSLTKVHSQGSILGPLLLIICINDPPVRINSVSEPVLFADDTSVIISCRNFKGFCSMLTHWHTSILNMAY